MNLARQVARKSDMRQNKDAGCRVEAPIPEWKSLADALDTTSSSSSDRWIDSDDGPALAFKQSEVRAFAAADIEQPTVSGTEQVVHERAVPCMQVRMKIKLRQGFPLT